MTYSALGTKVKTLLDELAVTIGVPTTSITQIFMDESFSVVPPAITFYIDTGTGGHSISADLVTVESEIHVLIVEGGSVNDVDGSNAGMTKTGHIIRKLVGAQKGITFKSVGIEARSSDMTVIRAVFGKAITL